MSLLSVRDLTVSFRVGKSWVPVVEDVSFDVEAGTTVGLVGESGSGKTVTSLSILGLTRHQGARVTGSITFEGRELVGMAERDLAAVRGDQISMIFQQASRSLDPAFTVGEQIAETVRRHWKVGRREAWDRAVEMLDRVRIPHPQERAKQYPHTFSGGMSQRAMIAMALACEPSLVIADEPTTALDVTVQARILDLLAELQESTGVAVLLISHDLGVIAEAAEQVIVMYGGRIVERAQIDELFIDPRHPYTSGLINAIPVVGSRRLVEIPGNVPSPGAMPAGCRFHPRCPFAQPGRCDSQEPPLEVLGEGPSREVRCHRHAEVALEGVARRTGVTR